MAQEIFHTNQQRLSSLLPLAATSGRILNLMLACFEGCSREILAKSWTPCNQLGWTRGTCFWSALGLSGWKGWGGKRSEELGSTCLSEGNWKMHVCCRSLPPWTVRQAASWHRSHQSSLCAMDSGTRWQVWCPVASCSHTDTISLFIWLECPKCSLRSWIH